MSIFLSYCHKNITEADYIEDILTSLKSIDNRIPLNIQVKIIRLLKDTSSDIHSWASSTLEQICDENTVKLITPLLDNRENETKSIVLGTLGKMGKYLSASTIFKMGKYINDKAATVQNAALSAFASINRPVPEKILFKIFKLLQEKDTNIDIWELRKIIENTKDTISDKSISKLCKVLTYKDSLIRRRVTDILIQLKDKISNKTINRIGNCYKNYWHEDDENCHNLLIELYVTGRLTHRE